MSFDPRSTFFSASSLTEGVAFGGGDVQPFRRPETQARRDAGPVGERSTTEFHDGCGARFRRGEGSTGTDRSRDPELRTPLPGNRAEAPRPSDDAAPERDMPMERSRAAMALWALGDETRLGIFRLLSAHSPESVSPVTISRALDIPPRTTSQQLYKLRRAGLVHETGAGRRKSYRADVDLVQDCLTLIHELTAVLHPA